MASSTTHIHDLLDDVLLRILWPSKQSRRSCRSDSDKLWKSVTPRPKFLYAHALPDERWCALRDTPLPIPASSADAAHGLFIASVCRRWRRLAQRHVSSLVVKAGRVVSHRDAINAVACFPNLTHLHLEDGSVETLDDAFLADLAASCPGLRALYVGKLTIEPGEGLYERDDYRITESGLDNLFRLCPQLEQLSLHCLQENLNPPASFFQLQHLRTLFLTTAFILKSPDLSSLSTLTDVSIETSSSSLHYDQLSNLLQLTSLTRLSLPDGIRVASADPPTFSFAELPFLESLKFGLFRAPFSVFFPLETPPYRLLKRLQLSDCSPHERLPDSIGQLLPRLQQLILLHCRSLTDLTDDFTSLTCLESLTISTCSVFFLPANFGNLPALKALVLRRLPLLHLPASFTRLASLETFFLIECEGMEELPAGFGCLTTLRTLSLAWSPTLDLPEDLGNLSSLQTFYLNKNSQAQLPLSFTQLVSLTRLELDQCAIADLPEGMAEMTNLQELYIQNCPALNELPELVSALVSLEVLRIEECHVLSSVPRRLDSLTRLTQLELRECWMLNQAPEALPLSLQVLSYENNQQGGSLPDVSALTALKELCLGTVGAACVETICARLSGVTHLQLVLAEEAGEALPALTRLPCLRTLTLKEIRSVNDLVGSDGWGLLELWQLNLITWREEFTELPAAITALHHLTSVQILAPKLSSLPDAIGSFPRLRKFNLSHCSTLTRLPASLTQLSCLCTGPVLV
ncbi:unnamed protein product [Closterium sp. NIES-65]|nr:unnamed protein product [Closterium sp. NIES-65]